MSQDAGEAGSVASATVERASQWEARYRAGRTGWDRGAVSPALERWLASGVLAPCHILLPGCGRGHEVLRLAAAGFDVTALDVAPSAIAHLRAALEGVGERAELLEADLLQWEPRRPFEAIYEQTTLCALDPPHWADYAERLYRWLVPGGRLLALFMQTGQAGGPPYHCAVARMRELFPASRWHWPEAAPLRVEHPTGLHELGYCLERRAS